MKRDVILIGHSQGGVIARWLFNSRDKHSLRFNFHSIFLLHAPQSGAYIANVRNRLLSPMFGQANQALQDMETNSTFSRLYEERCVDDGGNVYEVSGRCDYVDYHRSAFWKTKHRRYLSWWGHYYPAVNAMLWFRFIIPRLPKAKAKAKVRREPES